MRHASEWPPLLTPVRVRCMDMTGTAEWEGSWEPSLELSEIHVMGWLVAVTEDSITIASSLADRADEDRRQIGGLTCIPKSTVFECLVMVLVDDAGGSGD